MDYQTYVRNKSLRQGTKTKSVQARFSGKPSAFSLLTWFQIKADTLPPIGSEQRDEKLRELWPQEPFLAGAIYTMVSKIATLGWKVVGDQPRTVKKATEMLQYMGQGASWDQEVRKWTLDYLTQDRGSLFELTLRGKNGPVEGLNYMDVGRCRFTGDPKKPVQYLKGDGKWADLRPKDIIHRASMPLGMEQMRGAGVCFVSRAIQAVKLLMALHKYEEDQLSDMPPDGIAAITGMSQESVASAMDLWKAKRDSKDLSFRRILWLAGNPISGKIGVEWTNFAVAPKTFEGRDVVETYVKTLALCAGEDPNEFWLFQHAGATKATGEVMHRKARGKGVGEIMTVLSRAINLEALPDGVDFMFDEKDDEGDLFQATIKKEKVAYIKEMYAPPIGESEGLIPLETARQLLILEECLPADLAEGMPKVEAIEVDDEQADEKKPGDEIETDDEQVDDEKSLEEELNALPEELQHDIEERVRRSLEFGDRMFERKRRRFMESSVEELAEIDEGAKVADYGVGEIGLSKRTVKLLSNAGIIVVGDLMRKLREDETNISGIKGLGPKALDEIYVALKELDELPEVS